MQECENDVNVLFEEPNCELTQRCKPYTRVETQDTKQLGIPQGK